MDANIYFKDWVHGRDWMVRAALFAILLIGIFQFSLFSLTQNYVISYFGAQPEDVTFSIHVTYISLLFTLPLQVRFLNYFNTQKYLIVSTLIGIVLNDLMMKTSDIYFFMALRFLQGMVISVIAGGMLTLIFSRLHTEKKQAVGYSVFYGTLLGSSVVAGVPSAWVIDNMDWQLIFYIVILLQIVSIGIIFLVITSETKHKKYPLYQLDWQSYVVLCGGMLAVARLMVYGPKCYWFEDSSMIYYLLTAVFLLGLFVVRQLKSKRPIIDFSVFKSANFVTGLFLLASFYGLKDTINLVYSFISSIDQWPNYQYIELAFLNVAGMVLTMYVASQLILKRKYGIRFFLVSGFGLMLVFNYWMYQIISTDLSFSDLAIPIFLQGAASGMLFVPIATFILSSVPVSTGISGSLIAGNVRFFTTLNSFAGYYTLQLFYNQHFKERLLSHLTPYDLAYNDRISEVAQSFVGKGFSALESNVMAQANVMQSVKIQSQLLTDQAIFLLITIVLVVLIFAILLFPFFSKTYLKFNKRYIWILRN